MILVDSTVWIEYLRRGEHPVCALFDSLLEDGHQLCLSGLVLTEVLQGIRGPAQFRKVQRFLAPFPRIEVTEEDHILAAELYRTARSRGITPRSTVDCILAAICLQRDMPILHCDRDFDYLAELFELKVLS